MVYSNFENCFKEITMHSLTILQFPDLKFEICRTHTENVIETVNKRTLCWKNICILNALIFRLKIKNEIKPRYIYTFTTATEHIPL